MARHEPEGALLAIHSVCVAAAARRRGVATRLLRAYLQFVQASTPQLQEVSGVAQEGASKWVPRAQQPTAGGPGHKGSSGATLRGCMGSAQQCCVCAPAIAAGAPHMQGAADPAVRGRGL